MREPTGFPNKSNIAGMEIMIMKKHNSDLLTNLDKIHTTELGKERIKRNLGLNIGDAVYWCVQETKQADNIVSKGKNWYVYAGDTVITINAHSYTIITAHREKQKRIP